MAITDQQVLGEIQDHLLEPNNSGVSWASGKWTADEVIALADSRQKQFMKESGILLKRATILPVLPWVTRHPLPEDWIATQRAVWLDATAGTYTEIPRGDTWEATNAISMWTYQAVYKPQLYTDGEAQTLLLQTMPAVDASGQIDILYTYLSTTLTGAGVAFSVPDEFVPCIKWGIMEDMLSKVGRATDPIRAAYCGQRYREGVEAARIMLAGWM